MVRREIVFFLVLLFVCLFSICIFAEKVENVVIRVIKKGDEGLIYSVTNYDDKPIKWYKVTFQVKYSDIVISGSDYDSAIKRSKARYSTVKRYKKIFDYGPEKEILPSQTVEVYYKFPPLPSESAWVDPGHVEIICNSEPEPIKEKLFSGNMWTWIIGVVVLGVTLACI